MKRKFMWMMMWVLTMSAIFLAMGRPISVKAAGKPVYTISSTSKPYDKKIVQYPTYNKYLKHWYLLKSYMERLEKTGGGTLILKKGTYLMPIGVGVPSNVKIIFKDGVVLKKTSKTGTAKIKKNSSMFQLIKPSKLKTKNAVSAYNGMKNISFEAQGKVVFDMNYIKPGCAIIMCHNKKVTFDGITFQNETEHAFELDASDGVVIKNCTFQDTKGIKTSEAINIDIPDQQTGGFSYAWAKWDKTPNRNITISHCTFRNMNRAVGSHSYSQTADGKNIMHQNITIEDNVLVNVAGYEGAIVAYNWEGVTIRNNVLTGSGTKAVTLGIVCHSVVSPKITNNVMSEYESSILIRRGFVSHDYAEPASISVSESERALLSTNYCVRGKVLETSARVTNDSKYSGNVNMEFYPLELK